jgi:hypothetical protein
LPARNHRSLVLLYVHVVNKAVLSLAPHPACSQDEIALGLRRSSKNAIICSPSVAMARALATSALSPSSRRPRRPLVVHAWIHRNRKACGSSAGRFLRICNRGGSKVERRFSEPPASPCSKVLRGNCRFHCVWPRICLRRFQCSEDAVWVRHPQRFVGAALGHHGRSLTSDPKVMTYVATGRSHVFFTPAFDSQKRRIGLKFR